MKIGKKQNRKNEACNVSRGFGGIEPLESRMMMTAVHLVPIQPSNPYQNQTISVMNTNPTGDGSLSAAIATANKSPYVNVTINFSIPGRSTINEPGSTALPPIIRNNVTIDASAIGGVYIDGHGSGILAVSLYGANNCTFKSLYVENFNTAFADYSGSSNTFTQDFTTHCGTGLGLYGQSNYNMVFACGFSDSGVDAICVDGQYNNIGVDSIGGDPIRANVIERSSGNGIEVRNSNNFIVNNTVHGCADDCLVLDSGVTYTQVWNNGLSQGLAAFGDNTRSHGSCLDVKAGANNNSIVQSRAGLEFNRITYGEANATKGSYAINIQGTGNQINGNRVILNDGGDPSSTLQDIYIGPGNTYNYQNF